MFKIVLLLLLAGAVWLAAGPYAAVQNLTEALENESPARVDEYVDFDAVRRSLGDDFARRMHIDEGKPGSMGAMLATSIASSLIHGIVSPETMISILKDHDRRARMGLDDALVNILRHGSWYSDREFVLRNENGQPTMLLTRTGIRWEVTAIRF